MSEKRAVEYSERGPGARPDWPRPRPLRRGGNRLPTWTELTTLRPLSKAGVAQLVEQLIRNQQVLGSSPSAGSSSFRKLCGHKIGFSFLLARACCHPRPFSHRPACPPPPCFPSDATWRRCPRPTERTHGRAVAVHRPDSRRLRVRLSDFALTPKSADASVPAGSALSIFPLRFGPALAGPVGRLRSPAGLGFLTSYPMILSQWSQLKGVMRQ